MKRFFIWAVALLAICSCSEQQLDTTLKDSIELSRSSVQFDKNGGKTHVMVTSSDAWILSSNESFDWVTPSAYKGKDGDIITFEIDENFSEDRKAVYTFSCGETTADFTINSIAGELYPIELLIPDQISADEKAGQLKILVKTEVPYRDIKVSIPEEAASWLSFKATLEGEQIGTAEITLDVKALSDLDDRSAEIIISGPKAKEVTVKLTQFALDVLKVDEQFFTAPTKGGNLQIALTSNVPYEVQLSTEAEGWLSLKSQSAKSLDFSVQAGQEKKSAVITLTETTPEEGRQALSESFTITRVDEVITWAAKMAGNRLFPKWINAKPSNEDLKACTLETMIKVDNFGNEISTLMGVEDNFLLRFGDRASKRSVLQIAMNRAFKPINIEEFPFETGRWYHIACVYLNDRKGSATVKIYRDGQLIAETGTMLMYFPFNYNWSYEVSQYDRCWWFGYSYDSTRSLDGYMTEVRVWNRALTQEEIQAPGHFYQVSPDADGLMCYWKFTEGQGELVADKSATAKSLHENLYGETRVRNIQNVQRGDAGIEWVKVSLPDR